MSNLERRQPKKEYGPLPVGSDFTFDKNAIATRTGFKLAITYPEWETDGAGIVQFGEDVNFYGNLHGYDNVIATLFVEEGKLLFGLFIKGNITAIEVDASELHRELGQ